MSKQNCPNCAAPYDVRMQKCPYCGTAYFDLSVIDFADGEPCWMKIRINGVEITQRVLPRLDSIAYTSETTYFHDGPGNPVAQSMTASSACTTTVRFDAIAEDNVLFTAKKL